MTNINDFDPNFLVINEFTIFENRSTIFEVNYFQENNTPHIVFNNIDCIFRKSGVFSIYFLLNIKKQKDV